MTYTEPAADDREAIVAQQTRADVVKIDILGCSVRHHAGECVIETLSDGSTRHREHFTQRDADAWNDDCKTRVHVMTKQGLRS